MKEPSKMSVLGILMKRDAEISQPDNGRMADSWQVILQAISQPAPPAAHSSPTDPLRSDPENTRLWTPYTAFDSQNAPRGNTHFPGRRFVYQALALVMVVAVFLAIGLVIGRGNLLPTGKPTVTIPEDTIPLTEPSASRPSPADLKAFFSASDSEALARLPLLPGEQQRTGLQT